MDNSKLIDEIKNATQFTSDVKNCENCISSGPDPQSEGWGLKCMRHVPMVSFPVKEKDHCTLHYPKTAL